jgi:hypothetical protein
LFVDIKSIAMSRLLFLFTTIMFAQSNTIDSLNITPENPTTNDTIKVIAYTFSVSSPCTLAYYNVSINNDTISINTHYPQGPLTALCNSSDTAIIGTLDTGCYQLIYHMTDTTFPWTADIDTVSFCVTSSVGIEFTNISMFQNTAIYPNPSADIFNIQFPQIDISDMDITVRNVLGEVIKTEKIENTKQNLFTVNLSSHSAGIYFINVKTPSSSIDRKILMVR